METKKDKLYAYLNSGYFYTVDQLSEYTSLKKQRVREYISRIKNNNAASSPINLVQLQDEKGFKRWGIIQEKVKIGK